ncbi:P-loop containing nucleoside triphosphatehydrolases superfamily protein [Striga asiatica]|uniref:P-loop containing nucleoside triphosphatehydrolases superfamily protein n=1 Tax=Striga asiatica TaxID=4170 RepID=A0A5A7QH34_STRAF|nr:P-loop containing nucleoside triphosphatehydrolases superfamily protein [Striga asiatica]
MRFGELAPKGKTVRVSGPKVDNILQRVDWAVTDGIRASTRTGVPARTLAPKGKTVRVRGPKADNILQWVDWAVTIILPILASFTTSAPGVKPLTIKSVKGYGKLYHLFLYDPDPTRVPTGPCFVTALLVRPLVYKSVTAGRPFHKRSPYYTAPSLYYAELQLRRAIAISSYYYDELSTSLNMSSYYNGELLPLPSSTTNRANTKSSYSDVRLCHTIMLSTGSLEVRAVNQAKLSSQSVILVNPVKLDVKISRFHHRLAVGGDNIPTEPTEKDSKPVQGSNSNDGPSSNVAPNIKENRLLQNYVASQSSNGPVYPDPGPSAPNSGLTPKRAPLTARERLRAARVLNRYNDSKPIKTGLGSNLLEALRDSDNEGNRKRSGLPEAPTNLFDDSKRGLPKEGWTINLPGVGAIHFNEY